jgi:hypothetical protein
MPCRRKQQGNLHASLNEAGSSRPGERIEMSSSILDLYTPLFSKSNSLSASMALAKPMEKKKKPRALDLSREGSSGLFTSVLSP